MADPAPPPGFTIDAAPPAGQPSMPALPPGFTVDEADPAGPSEDEFKAQIHHMLATGASAKDIHSYVTSSGYEDSPTIDQAVAFAKANPTRAQEVGIIAKPLAGGDTVSVGKPDTHSGWEPEKVDAYFNQFPEPTRPGLEDKLAHGFTLGLDTEATGAASALGSLAMHPITAYETGGQSVADAYHEGRQKNLAALDYVDQHSPITGTIGDIGGMVMSPLGAGGTTLKDLAIGGAKIGGIHGFEQGDDTLVHRLISGGEEALTSAAAAPIVGKTLGLIGNLGAKATGAANRLLGRDTSVGARLVSQKLAQDDIAPDAAAAIMDNSQKLGTPTTIADLGENVRALAGSVSRQPGVARNIAKSATGTRQLGQVDRIKDAINRDLGPTTDVLQTSNDLMKQAQTAAAPLYEKAYANPVVTTPRLDALLNTPAGKQAVARARTIAANEMHNPEAMGFALDKDGNVALNPTVNLSADESGNLIASQEPAATKGYTTQTLDYVKRGLDDILEQKRNPLTGKLVLDESGRAINSVKNGLLSEIDKLNPDYAAARQAYAGPASMRSAMLDGKAALNKSASEIDQRLQNMSDPERQQYALGLRSAIADKLDAGTDGANKVLQVIGSPKKRAVLAKVFGDSGKLDDFISTLGNEQAAFDTYFAVHRGSQTAERAAEDSANSDTNLLKQLGADLAAIKDGKGAVAGRLFDRLSDAAKFGAGKTGQRTREDASALLFSSDPLEFRNAMRNVSDVDARTDFNRKRIEDLLTRGGLRIGSGTVATLNGIRSTNAGQ